MTTLSFNSNGSLLAAKLHLPVANDSSRKPGVIVVGSWLTVKEQMPANYAPLLAAAGFAALTFDFRGFGVSEGLLREVESAKSKAEDILNAAAFLGSRPEVDSERIAVLAICASASYTALALQGASRDTSSVKSVAMVAPWIHDAELVAQLYGGEEAVRTRLLRARAARERYVQTGEVEYIQAASNQDQSAAMYGAGDMLDYYLNPERGALPEWGGRFGVMGWTEWLQSDFVTLARQFALPLCMVTGPGTATPAGAKKFAAALPEPPQVVSLDGSQFDFYDKPENVRASCARAVAHFHKTLG
jgi:fermentation-respiration switch protein FrsA (DUF1100 family)